MINIRIDIETLRSPEYHRLQILDEVKANFKAPSSLSKTQAASDLGLTDTKEIKFTSKDDMIAKWEKELAQEKSADVAHEKWAKTSFDPNVAQIACICIGWYENGTYYTDSFDLIKNENETKMLSQFHAVINDICTANCALIHKPNFVGHYIAKFDLPFIFKRSIINRVKVCDGVKWIDAKHGINCYDTMTAWSGYGNSISMNDLASILNIKGKTEGMDGSLVYDTWQTDHQKVIDYCNDDVQVVKEIYERLTNYE